uniref:Lipid-binding serum glycoprotein N-terminal domain-containing protein n=1 Tax=Heliothis virescens TaxID=7102 RepID=A0A2A4JDQ8_HELVI
MWVLLFVTYCVYFVQSVEKFNIDEEFGSLHIRMNTAELPAFLHPKTWVDRRATRRAITFVHSLQQLPELKPYKIDHLGTHDINVPDLHITGNITVADIIVTGINDIHLQTFDMQVEPPRIDFNFTVPKITVEANFDLHCPSLFYYDYQSVRERGNFRLTLTGLSMTAVLGPVPIRHFKGSVFAFENAVINIHIDGVQLQIQMAHSSETFIRILHDFVNHIEDIIFDNDVLDIVLEAVNVELENVPSSDILKYLIGTSSTSIKRLSSETRRRARRRYRKRN